MSIPHPGAMHRKSLFDKNGNFDETFKIAGDYELLLRELKSGNAEFIPIIVSGVRPGGVSSDAFNSLVLLREVRRAHIQHGLYIPSANFLFSLFKAIVRKLLYWTIGETMTNKIVDFVRQIVRPPEQ